MKKPLLIIVTGAPCTGKTKLAGEVSLNTGIPCFSRDAFKEILFNSLGTDDRKWSKKLGLASYNLLFFVLNQFVQSKKSIMVESNFDSNRAKPDFLKIESIGEFNILQIVLMSDADIIMKRFLKRAISGERHPGHVDETNIDELKIILTERDFGAIDLESEVIIIDTNDFEMIEMNPIYCAIDKLCIERRD